MSSIATPDLGGLQQAFPYPRSSAGAIPVLQQEIAALAPLSFQDYMELCLYHPEYGYYARVDQKTVSKEGDFMTSVSVGPCFGKLLARRIRKFHQANGSPEDFVIVEVGGHDGSLALDILAELEELEHSLPYFIIEPLPLRRKFLQEKLGDRVTILAEPKKLSQLGFLLANEVLDALPVPIWFFSNDQWHEAAVTADFQWTSKSMTTSPPQGQFPEGYVTEGPPELEKFLTPITKLFDQGLMVFIDYGLDEENLYSTSRTVGTFRCYRQHQSNSHPLDYPGQQDLTADVNFTAVEGAAKALGLETAPVMNQSRYLTYCAKEWLTSQSPPDAAMLRQFQTLIHPSQFGSRFYVLELTQGNVERAF